MENKKHIDNFFRDTLANYEVMPSKDMWSRIERKIHVPETPPDNLLVGKYSLLIFLFISLCLIGPNLNINSTKIIALNNNNNNPSQQIPSVIINNQEIELNTIPSSSQNKINKENSAKINSIVSAKKTIPSEITTEINNSISENNPDAQNQLPENELNIQSQSEERSNNSIVALTSYSPDKIKSYQNYEVNERNIDNTFTHLNIKGMYIGISGSYNQTSILEYGNNFSGEKPIQPSLKFGTAKGISVGYNFSNTFGLQAEFIYNSIEGQNYVLSEGDQITQKTLALNYDQIPLTAKMKVGRISDVTHRPIVLNYIAGIQYGFLREYRIPQEKRYESTDNLLKQDDWSFILGLDYDIYLQDHLFISLGTRGTISNDISLHAEPLNDYAKRNFVFGLRGSINYVFR